MRIVKTDEIVIGDVIYHIHPGVYLGWSDRDRHAPGISITVCPGELLLVLDVVQPAINEQHTRVKCFSTLSVFWLQFYVHSDVKSLYKL